MSGPSLPSLLIFADDWGRHPSSCQHLIGQLLGRYQVIWVNTIGMRPPRFNLATLRRGGEKVRQWLSRTRNAERGTRNFLELGARNAERLDLSLRIPRSAFRVRERSMQVLNPRMWPWFTAPLDRRINRALLTRQLRPLLRTLQPPAVALTTIPVVADLVGTLPVRKWIYYCVDDFGVWPGLDSRPLRRMEVDLVRQVDQVIAVSETLREKLRQMGRAAQLLTHGVDLDFWQHPAGAVPSLDGLERPLIVFWGVCDRRMDSEFLRRLAGELVRGTIVLVGPEDDPDPALATLPRTVRLGSLPFAQLPAVAREAAALVMPYADLPVTRAMQPLKLKEYLATGRPVVIRDLPATRAWADCADVVSRAQDFAEAVRLRLETGLPDAQRAARQRLASEGWTEKARLLERWILEPTLESARPPRGVAAETTVLETRVVRGSGGGPDKTILNSPRFLTARGYRTLCAYLHPPDDPGFAQLRHKAERWGAPLLSIADRGFWDLGIIPEMLAICRRERVRIWHGHDYKSNALGLLLRRFWPMKFITTVHGWVHHTPRTPLYYRIDRLCLPRYDLVLCVSADLHERALACGVAPQRCVLLENAIDTEEFRRRTSIAESKCRLGLPAERFLIGSVGRLSAEKGFDILIRSLDRLLRSGRDAGLVLVGEGDEEPRLRALIHELGHGERIRLLGYRPDVPAIYQALDVFALSSHREGLPNVLLEALAFEVPVVATRIAGIPKLITDGDNGLLVPPGELEALADALTRLYDDPALRGQLAHAGRRTIEERYSFRERMKKIADLYDQLLALPAV